MNNLAQTVGFRKFESNQINSNEPNRLFSQGSEMTLIASVINRTDDQTTNIILIEIRNLLSGPETADYEVALLTDADRASYLEFLANLDKIQIASLDNISGEDKLAVVYLPHNVLPEIFQQELGVTENPQGEVALIVYKKSQAPK